MKELSWDNVFINDSVTILVNQDSMGSMLKDIGNEVDEDGDIIDSITKEKVVSQDEGNVKLKELGTISSGSKNFIKKNIASYSEFLSQKRN
jgi:hypothetical protein